jgi:hypothetical protein
MSSNQSNSVLGVIARRVALESQMIEIDDHDSFVLGPNAFNIGKNTYKLVAGYSYPATGSVHYTRVGGDSKISLIAVHGDIKITFKIRSGIDNMPDLTFVSWAKNLTLYPISNVVKAIQMTLEEYGKREIEEINRLLEFVR